MTDDQKRCGHPTLYFGSGAFYVICRTCGMTWLAKKIGADERDVADYDAAASNLTGEHRFKK